MYKISSKGQRCCFCGTYDRVSLYIIFFILHCYIKIISKTFFIYQKNDVAVLLLTNKNSNIHLLLKKIFFLIISFLIFTKISKKLC